MLAADRIARALPEGLGRRARGVEGGEVVEIDGLLVGLTNIPTPELNTVGVVREPDDPVAALVASEEVFRSRGHSFFGVELEPGRFPGVDSALRALGLVRVVSRPAMAVEIGSLPDLPDPPGVTIARIRDRAPLEDLRRIDAVSFGTAPAVSAALLDEGWLALDACRQFLARGGDEALGGSTAWLLAGTVGVFGVCVLPNVRRRGIGASLTVRAAAAFGDAADLAWLNPSASGRAMYEGLGFRPVATSEVWIRPPA